jgi:predicted AlkP superfamily phosphohydrolase/phosphomutase
MFTPGTHVQFTYPPDLQTEILDLVDEYQLDIPWQHYLARDPLGFLADLRSMARQRAKIVQHLQQRHPVDMLVAVFVGPDRINHALWGYAANGSHSGGLPDFEAIRQEIESYYAELDSHIGAIIAAAGQTPNVILMSDHGFGQYRLRVFLNKWLAEIGLLTPRGSQLLRSFWSALKRTAKTAVGEQRLSRLVGRRGVRMLKQAANHIDWKRTRAYSTWVGIQINLAGREKEGIVQPGAEYEALRDEIIERLGSLVDPETGEQVFGGRRREEVYKGKFADEAPGDIILFPADAGYQAFSQAVDVPELFAEPEGWSPGCHRPDGIFLAHGPAFRRGFTVKNAHIIDLAPTILYALDLPIPEDVDGRPLEQIFEHSFRAAHPVQRAQVAVSGDEPQDSVDAGLEDADQALVEDRLSALGYM